MSALGGENANQASARSADENRRFQQMMASTAHQREVNDLRAAGLNPILSANAGAATPSGATSQFSNVLEGALSSARERKQLELGEKKQEAEIGLLNAQKSKAETETRALGKDVEQNTFFESIWKKLNNMRQTVSSQPSFDPERDSKAAIQKWRELTKQKPIPLKEKK